MTGVREVTDTHVNSGTDLTDLTVKADDGYVVVLNTTQHHAFSSAPLLGSAPRKICLAVDGCGQPLSILLTPGLAGHNPQLLALLDTIGVNQPLAPAWLQTARGADRSNATLTTPFAEPYGSAASGTSSPNNPIRSTALPPNAAPAGNHQLSARCSTRSATWWSAA